MDLSDLLKKANKVYEQFPNKWDGKTELVNLIEELGELANAVLIREGEKGEKSEKRRRAELEDSFADVFLALAMLADKYDVDVEHAVLKALGEIEERQKRGEYE